MAHELSEAVTFDGVTIRCSCGWSHFNDDYAKAMKATAKHLRDNGVGVE